MLEAELAGLRRMVELKDEVLKQGEASEVMNRS